MLRITAAFLVAGALATAQARISTGRGYVHSTDGKPLERVWVQLLGTFDGRATEADGRFDFPPAGVRVNLLFFRDGFRPLIRVIEPSEDVDGLIVTLKPETGPVLNLRSCSHRKPILPELRVARIAGLRFYKGGDVDFAGYSAAYDYRGSRAYISSTTGVHIGSLSPEWAWGLSSFSVRSLRCGGWQWFDLRGVTASGLQSRWVGAGVSYVEYSKVPPPVAQVFDKAIDKGCCR